MKRLGKVAGRGPAGFQIKRATPLLALFFIFIILLASSHSNAEQVPGLLEDFNSLERWEDFYFQKIKEYTDYSLGMDDGVTFLMSNSSASASAFMLKGEINVYETPLMSWRWRADNVYEKGDLTTRKGDDSPLRIYVMFEYDPERATTWMKFKYAVLEAIYGQYPPHASLNYIWASRTPEGSVLRSPYTGRVMMIVQKSGPESLGIWYTEEANILEDYRRAFGEDPPESARIAVMNDSDNTGESAVSYIDYIEISEPALKNTTAQ